eukprot:CAMPEP_0181351628 /NCGR_PEP_ID=MMETSP1106-20121128/1890_1 /TAXON_ID=81844 /ORGANISM="Mantoniella antarctica, Strain SL-175" /LENGTH=670 /DNA_ID=CAMNT_0023464159 /DNA_START=184 /DNA_END=2193 /DNA_ORIENTATION=+
MADVHRKAGLPPSPSEALPEAAIWTPLNVESVTAELRAAVKAIPNVSPTVDGLNEVIAAADAGIMPQSAQVRPLTEAVSCICSALERAVPPATAAAACLRRCLSATSSGGRDRCGAGGRLSLDSEADGGFSLASGGQSSTTHPRGGLLLASGRQLSTNEPINGRGGGIAWGGGSSRWILDAKVAALASECFDEVERLDVAGRIAVEWSAFAGWAMELGQVLAAGHGRFELQRDGLVARLRGLQNLPSRLLDRLDEIDPPEFSTRSGSSGEGSRSSVEDHLKSAMSSAAVDGGSTCKRPAFESKLLRTPSWAVRANDPTKAAASHWTADANSASSSQSPAREAAGTGAGTAATGAALKMSEMRTRTHHPQPTLGAMSPTQAVEVLDEVVEAAVMGAGPLRLDKGQLGFCVAQLEGLQATAHIMSAAEDACGPLRDKLAMIGECRRNADGALAVLGRQLRARTQHRRRDADVVDAANGWTCTMTFTAMRRHFRRWNIRALILGTLTTLAGIGATGGVVTVVYSVTAGHGRGMSGGVVVVGIAMLGVSGATLVLLCLTVVLCSGGGSGRVDIEAVDKEEGGDGCHERHSYVEEHATGGPGRDAGGERVGEPRVHTQVSYGQAVGGDGDGGFEFGGEGDSREGSTGAWPILLGNEYAWPILLGNEYAWPILLGN